MWPSECSDWELADDSDTKSWCSVLLVLVGKGIIISKRQPDGSRDRRLTPQPGASRSPNSRESPPSRLEQTIIPLQRILLKIRTIVSFFGNTRNPLALTIDALKLSRRPLVAVSRDGIKLRLNPSSGESFTFYENLIRRDYLAHGITLRPGDTVVDIGANIGSFTVLAARVVGPHGRVVSFEPVAQTFARLEDNVALNGYRNVECRRAAVDAQEGTLTLRVDPKSALSTAYVESDGDEDGAIQTAPCVTLEQAFRDHNLKRVNLLKVDCEGSEYGIFETLAPSLAARIDQIAMEVHPIASRSTEQLRERLRALGFDVRPGQFCWVAFNTAVQPVETCANGPT
jgi:FkbM family methyltransferase